MYSMLVLSGCRPARLIQKDIDLSRISDGIYRGYWKHLNQAEVEITIENGNMTDIRLLVFDATPFGKPAGDSIPARMLREQTPYVDAVSGATEASVVIINAVVNALAD